MKSAPTVAGLATNTLKLPEYSHNTTEVLNSERDAAVLFATDTDPEPDHDDADDEPAPAPRGRGRPQPRPPPRHPLRPTAPAGAPRPDDIAFDASDATLALIALSAKMRIDQIEALDSIESITDGASSRRNQLLVDLGSELDLGAIDGAAEADLAGLKAQVTKLARTYKPYGPVLSDAINDQLRTVLGPSGKRPAAIAERVKKTWELGDGWAKHVTVEVALGTREGSSVRGGSLGGLHDGALADAATRRQGHRRRRGGGGRPTRYRGGAAVGGRRCGRRRGGLRGADRVRRAGHRPRRCAGLGRPHGARTSWDSTTPVSAPETATDAELIDLVTAELGSDWPRLVAPVFDGRKAVLFDDRWASAREDLVKLWLMDEGEIDADWPRLSERFEGAGHVVGTQASWWQGKALAAGRNVHASLFGRAAAGAENPGKGRYSDEIAVVTGASKGSIAASVVAGLLDGGATVIATTSKLDDNRLAFYRNLYRDNARFGAALWVVPANMASYSDIDALVRGSATSRPKALGRKSIHLKDAQTPTLLFPFAAPRVAGDLSEAGSRSEMEMKVLLWAVQRLIGGLSHIGSERDIASRLHVVLPGSPNRGMFGGDGAYGESKSALDAVVTRWKAESSWAQRVSLAHALIGWTRGTGLMGANDAIVSAVEEAGVTTYSTEQMAADAARAVQHRVEGGRRAGAAEGRPDRRARRHRPRHVRAGRQGPRGDGSRSQPTTSRGRDGTIAALPSPPRGFTSAPPPAWDDLDVDPADLVVIVGGAELGPYGSSRTRFEMEVDNELSAAGVLELAWTTGLIKWEDDPKPGWYDTESGDLVDESELVERYHDAVVERRGIREFVDDGAIDPDHASPLLVSVFLDKDFTLRGVVGGRRPRVRPVRPGAHRCDPGAGQQRLAGHPQGGHRDPGAAQDQAVADRRRADPDRVRPDGVRHQRGHEQLAGPGGGVEHRRDRRRVPRRRLHPDRADALGAPDDGGQHAGHRHGRHDVDADHVPRQPARTEQAERHPAGSPAERHCGARDPVLRRQLRRDDPPGRRMRDRGGVGRGGRRQDQAGQGRAGGRRRLRRPDAGGASSASVTWRPPPTPR